MLRSALSLMAAAHPTVGQAVEAGWSEFKAALRRDCASPDGRLKAWLEGALINVGEGLLREPGVRTALNARLRSLLVELADRHGEDVAKLVSETIRRWDSATIVEKLESNVGRDLQYIRLNGTAGTSSRASTSRKSYSTSAPATNLIARRSATFSGV